jgi:hypothetical protein
MVDVLASLVGEVHGTVTGLFDVEAGPDSGGGMGSTASAQFKGDSSW